MRMLNELADDPPTVPNTGSSSAASIPMLAMTASSSIKVNPARHSLIMSIAFFINTGFSPGAGGVADTSRFNGFAHHAKAAEAAPVAERRWILASYEVAGSAPNDPAS